MASSSRNPKDLKQIIDASHQDMSEIQANLSKLRALTEDDKTENALLRSRIDEQSQLIMILKQRTDEAVNHARTLERMNDELRAFREEAGDRLQRELKRYNMLDARFSDLASNHEELIKFKDEYKRQNELLRQENARIKDENARLFSKTIEEKDSRIRELDKQIGNVTMQCVHTEQKNKELAQLLRSTEEKYKQENRNLQISLKDTEEQLRELRDRLKRESDQKESVSAETQERLNKLTKEKGELLNLAMSRGKLIQETQAENKRLQQNIDDMEKQVRNMQAKFERDAATVNKNLTVQKLRQELVEAEENYQEVVREFNAYKKHSTNLLQKERELNEKLRHLVS